MKVLGFVGLAGSGKDTAADILVQKRNYVKVALADPLKRFCREVYDFSEEQLWGPSSARNAGDPRYSRSDGSLLSPRVALQTLGTEWGRHCYETTWADYAARMVERIKKGSSYSQRQGCFVSPFLRRAYGGIVITDFRFPNENARIGAKIMRLHRGHGLQGKEGQHASERLGSEIVADVEFDNSGGLETLERAVLKFEEGVRHE